MKLRAPDSCIGVSYRGRNYGISSDGSIDLDEEACAALAGHGFAIASTKTDAGPQAEPERTTVHVNTVEGPADDDIEGLNRVELFALLRSKGVSVSLPITNLELRRLARLDLER